MLDRDGYRPNVGIILCNSHNQVFWGKRIREHAWQFPQGGIDSGESPEVAMYRELMEEVDRTVDHMKVDSVHCPDPNDRATQESDMGMELRTRERERKLLNKISKTLKKIDEHEYGYCESCGVEIGIRRLEARPTADLCIDCKTRQEELERVQG